MSEPYEALVPGSPAPELLRAAAPLRPFAPEACAFLEALSDLLLQQRSARAYAELTALAYWMRRASIRRLQADCAARQGTALLLARGTVFHIAPANVDTIFVYSWALSLLTGNRNIVRLSSRSSPQTEVLLDAIAALLGDAAHRTVGERTLLLRYAPDDALTGRLSAQCDARIVWGGDATVAEIRRIPLPATAIEVAFADKQSIALVDAARWNGFDQARRDGLAESFYTDAYWFGQMACSSPRVVLWLGTAEATAQARADFWPRVERVIARRQERFSDIDYVDKLVAADSLAIELPVRIEASANNDLTRLWVDRPGLRVPHFCGAGLFLESRIAALDELRPLLDRKLQTVCYAGLDSDELRAFVAAAPLAGVDRFVPFGRALEFAPVWDGFDLMRVFAREVTVI
ncbi:MAG: acyl-CoA reductase [Nevskia sp.]|nr:acyl-CoA reductase [Nevskia sp.]